MITTELKNVRWNHEFIYKGLAFKRGMLTFKETHKVLFFREKENGNEYFRMDESTLVETDLQNLRPSIDKQIERGRI